MAILIRGKTRCALCRRELLDIRTDVVMFPPFVANRRSPLLVFHDAALHRTCVESHPLGQRVLQLAEQVPQRAPPGSHRCVARGEEIMIRTTTSRPGC